MTRCFATEFLSCQLTAFEAPAVHPMVTRSTVSPTCLQKLPGGVVSGTLVQHTEPPARSFETHQNRIVLEHTCDVPAEFSSSQMDELPAFNLKMLAPGTKISQTAERLGPPAKPSRKDLDYDSCNTADGMVSLLFRMTEI